METLSKPSLFWDVRNVNPDKNGDFVIDRILGLGDEEDLRWAIAYYGIDKIKVRVENGKNLDDKSLSFWCKYFDIDEQLCIQKQSKVKQGAFWKRSD
jgi:hypothetical protein